MQQDDKRLGRGRGVVVGIRHGLHAVEPDSIGVNIVMAPGARNPRDRGIGSGHHPVESAGADSPPAAGAGWAFSAEGVSAAVVSRTLAMVSRGPLIRLTLR